MTTESAMHAVKAGIAERIPLPDHPIRSTTWYQLYNRLARPTLDWIGNIGAAYAVAVGHWIGRPMPETYAVIVLAFVAGLYGVKSFEKTRGVS